MRTATQLGALGRLNRNQSAWPECEVCGAPVEMFEVRRASARAVFIVDVRCHGNEQTFDVPMRTLMEATSMSVGKAFTCKRIGPEPARKELA